MDLYSFYTLQWALVVIAVIVAIYLYGTWPYNEFRHRGMEFPKPTFFVGNLGQFALGKISLGDTSIALYNKYKGHRALGFFNFLLPTVYVLDPDLIKMVTVKDFEYFGDRVSMFTAEDDLLFGNILFVLKGSKWKGMRSVLSPAFTSSKMKAMFGLVSACGDQLGHHLRHKCNDEKDSSLSLEMRDLFSRYTNDVIATSAFGVHVDSLQEPTNQFYMMGKEATNFGGLRAVVFMLYLQVPSLMRLIGVKLSSSRLTNFFVSLVTDSVRAREKEHIFRPDMIQLMMQARNGTLRGDNDEPNQEENRDTKTATGAQLSDDEMAAQAFQFFVAGFDTSSTHLSFLAYELARHPDIQERVQQEIDEVIRDNKGILTYDGIQKMRYLDNVISETLRLWPPIVELNRICLREYIVPATADHPRIHFKKGDSVMIPVYGLHMDPEYFPEPKRFDPDRFNEENKHMIQPFTYLPFGAGPRNCIGSRFALMETKIAIACILSRFNITVTSRTPIPVRLAKATFNTSAEGGFWLAVKPRV